MAAADGPREWYAAIPPVTRAWLTGAVVAAVATKARFISPSWFLFKWDLVAYNFQVYRLLTPFVFFGPLSFNTLFALSWLYNYGKRYELSAFPSGGGPGYGNIADYVYSLCLAMVVLLLLSAALGFYALAEALNMFVIYLWAKRHPEEQASLWFFQFPGIYLPWVLVGWAFAMDGDPIPGLAGIAVGHTFYYILDVLPRGDGPLRNANKWLQTPDFVYRIFGVGPTGVAAQARAPGAGRAGVPPPPPARHVWGGGQALGGGDRPHRD